MNYLKFSRRPGSALVFRMRTPPALIGTTNPRTGRPFGKWIELGTGTRNPAEARRVRDILLGEIRKLEDAAVGTGKWSDEDAEGWAKEIARYEATSTGEPDEDAVDPRSVLEDMMEQGPPSKRLRGTRRDRFLRIARGTGYPLDKALERYLEERAPGSRGESVPLTPATARDVRTAVRYLAAFAGDREETLCLQDIDAEKARQFRQDYLPALTSPRAPEGLSGKTIEKHITLLSGMWEWARQRGILTSDTPNPWHQPRGPRRSKPPKKDRMFAPEQVTTLLQAYPQGDRLGDIMRLALVTGCRSDELAALAVDAVDDGAVGFHVRAGKTDNAPRYVPLIEPAQQLLGRRLEASASDGSVFPEWPVRPATGKRSALPQAFTRVRRRLLGTDTDGTLVFHSFRHTWRTVARWARVREDDLNDLGGWSGERRSSNRAYDQGQLKEHLREAQNSIAEMMRERGFLAAF